MEQDTVKKERERILSGNMTAEEFQTLCHNLHEKGTPCTRAEFEEGCKIFTDKLFGVKDA